MANKRITFNRFATDTVVKESTHVYKDLHAFQQNRTTSTKDIDVLAISNSLKNLMDFKPGQRILDINFGNPLYAYLYESMSSSFEIESVLENYIKKYEPRIQIKRVDIEKDEDNCEIYLNVRYTILNQEKFVDNFSMKIGDNTSGR